MRTLVPVTDLLAVATESQKAPESDARTRSSDPLNLMVELAGSENNRIPGAQLECLKLVAALNGFTVGIPVCKPWHRVAVRRSVHDQPSPAFRSL